MQAALVGDDGWRRGFCERPGEDLGLSPVGVDCRPPWVGTEALAAPCHSIRTAQIGRPEPEVALL